MRILLLNQCFYPDVVSTGQHLTDLAVALAEQGHQVRVIAGSRGYDNPQTHFPRRERWRGIDIVRLPSFGLGKTARWRRALNFASLILFYLLRLAATPRQDLVIAMTSPPLIAFIASLFVQIKGGRLVYWIMDLNPDEAIAAGWLREGSIIAKALNALQQFSLRKADTVIALDRFMKQKLVDKGISPGKIEVIAPWSHDDSVAYYEEGRESFRAQHGLTNKFVVMHSGNHSPCHPLDTLLDAAERLRSRTEIVFCFIGGGSEFSKVKAFVSSRNLKNILCLPYQPREELSSSLSAADLHVVVMGEPFVGIVHPCKIYNVLVVGSPFLYIGPAESHVTDIVQRLEARSRAWIAAHGDVDKVVRHIDEAVECYNDPSAVRTECAVAFSASNQLAEMLRTLNATPLSVVAASRSVASVSEY